MSAFDKAKTLFDAFKSSFDVEPCDFTKCDELLAQLKVVVFSTFKSAAMLSSDAGSAETNREILLARDTLELACFLSIRRDDLQGFERHVAQLKMYYNDSQRELKPSEEKNPIIGMYLLHLLASDRIGEFHTELELIPVDDYANVYIKQPIQLERYLMEGNYVKVLAVAKDTPHRYCSFFTQRLDDMVRQKVGASLERSYESLPAQDAANMLILNDVPALQEFAMKENERKAREELDDPMGDMTPSLTRRAPVGLVRWEVKEGRLYFTRSAEKRMEIPALDLMANAIGYATDLERIV
jgi:26S proteasome regulatory subunit N12|eukprot:TRINITY_DN2415_c0_g1_i1.p1 TRINITY_DN2415_c0_g1~~TRINITY_DN2415_c0_g1_i1.p1  ORF type:complete len:316 (+),score=78.81 TRINITY_DN2415_c0_g1_i1:59-949(+)